jgi:hypothetical protein
MTLFTSRAFGEKTEEKKADMKASVRTRVCFPKVRVHSVLPFYT